MQNFTSHSSDTRDAVARAHHLRSQAFYYGLSSLAHLFARKSSGTNRKFDRALEL